MTRLICLVLCQALLAAPVADEAWKVLENESSRMLSDYLRKIAARQLADRRQKVAALHSRAEFEKRRGQIRTALLRMVGDVSEPRTALNMRKTGSLDRDDYRVDKLVYESRPKYFVTASLYVPKTGQPPFPAVLQPIGHSLTGKNRAFYQTISIGLVKQGFVVLTYDPIGQGERRVFYDRELEDSRVGGSTEEHTMVGMQSLLAGESVARHRIWDGIRSLDLLQSLAEVDAKRVGVTGCSGGGTLTTYIAAIDDRVRVAAPACYISAWEDQLAGTGPQDAEQQFPDQLKEGIDHADLVTLAAPKPYLILSTDQDFFPLEGARKTFAEAKRIYSFFDAADRVEWFHEPGPHGTPKASREAMYAWMNRWLKGGPTVPAREPSFVTEYEEDLSATPTGQVATSLGGETASTWNMKKYRDVVPPRPQLSTADDVERLRERMRSEIIALTRYVASGVPLNVRTIRTLDLEAYRAELLAFDSDDGLVVPGVLCQPKSAANRGVVLYVDSAGKTAALGTRGTADALARMGYTVLAVDPAGVGETKFARNPAAPWSSHGPAWVALMIGRPVVGFRMNDIMRALDVLAAKNLAAGGVIGFARGRLGVDLLHAAVLDTRLRSVVVEEGLISYRAIAETPIHREIHEIVIPGVLGKYDLPDLAAALAPRPFWLVNPRSPLDKPVFRRDAESAYAYASTSYRAAHAAAQLRIRLRRESEPLTDVYADLR